jgi:hypothetical protein
MNSHLEIPSLISGVFDDDVCLVVLEVPQRKQDDVSLIYPDLK